MNKPQLILTCEHAENKIPSAYKPLFKGQSTLLQSHRGWDIGAQKIYDVLKKELDCPGIKAQWSRLLIDLNRSTTHRQLFSVITQQLDKASKQAIIKQYYQPYIQRYNDLLAQQVAKHSRVLHISVHSFTPSLNGQRRHADIGLLYDPSHAGEKAFAKKWSTVLQQHQPGLLVRMNYPYRGISIGITTLTRRQYPRSAYLGLELEINQALLTNSAKMKKMQTVISQSLQEVLS